MDSSQFETAFLIETKSVQIVVCCNEENTLATFCARRFNGFLYEQGPKALSFAQTIKGDDLTVTS